LPRTARLTYATWHLLDGPGNVDVQDQQSSELNSDKRMPRCVRMCGHPSSVCTHAAFAIDVIACLKEKLHSVSTAPS